MSVFFFAPRQVWAVQWSEDGKRTRKYFKTQQEAEAFECERLARVSSEQDRLTLGELTALFFRSRPDLHDNTRNTLVNFFSGREESDRHIEGSGEFLRDKFADSLNRQDLERMREILRAKGDGNNTINKYQAYIRAILAWGADQSLISHNPWRDFKRLTVQKKIVTTSIANIQAAYVHMPDWLQWAVKTLYALSLRPGHVELFGLLWTAFDWRRGVVFVRQGKSGRIKTVYPPALYLDEAYMRFQEDMKSGIALVCHREGKRVLSYREAWSAAIKKAGLPHFRMYDVRHVAATEMLAGGADLAAVSAQLGHSSITTTGTVYAHVTAGSQQRAAALMPVLGKDNGKEGA